MSTLRKNRKSLGPERTKTFVGHIAELQTRLLWVAGFFLLASALAYQFRELLVNIVLSPIDHQKLVYLTPGGGFSFIFQIMIYAGLLAAAPVFIVQLYRFLKPALPARAKRYSVRMALASLSLLAGGVLFGYLVAIPSALKFLMEFAGNFVDPNLTADSYLNFVVAYVVGLGILFQLPLLLIIWNWINPLPPGRLLASQQYVLVFAFIAGAIITPTPDIINQTMVAGPIIAIYQLGVVSVFIMNKRERRKQARQAVAAKVTSVQEEPAPVVPLEQPRKVVPQPALATTQPQKKAKRQVHADLSFTQPSVLSPGARRTVVSMDGVRQQRSGGIPLQRPSAVIAPSRSSQLQQPSQGFMRSASSDRRASVDGFAIR